MNVQEIYLEDMVLQTKDGFDCTEGSNIQLKNLRLITTNTNPVMNIHDSKNIVLDKIGYKEGAELLLNVSGEKSEKISLRNTDTTRTKKKVEFTYGAVQKMLMQSPSP